MVGDLNCVDIRLIKLIMQNIKKKKQLNFKNSRRFYFKELHNTLKHVDNFIDDKQMYFQMNKTVNKNHSKHSNQLQRFLCVLLKEIMHTR